MLINDFVVDVLVWDRKLKVELVWMVENYEKYLMLYCMDDDVWWWEVGCEVFVLMCNLNELGV